MNDNYLNPNHKIRIIVGVCIMLAVAAIHGFRVGSYLSGDWYILYYSFASDIIIPFGFYFLLVMNETKIRVLQKWHVRALIVFGLSTFTEIMQAFGVYFLGVTFDILDIVMFAIGTSMAVFFDRIIFEKLVPSWDYKQHEE